MSIELLGYSERGIVNAICEDIHHSANPSSMLRTFLSWFTFPEGTPNISGEDIRDATLLVEQGFSDFGDLDLLILVECRSGRKLCFLIEAKVSNDTNSWQTVSDRWNEFRSQLAGKTEKTSNLFVQLHRKTRLVAKLRDHRNFTTDCLVPRGSTGTNRVVSKACDTLGRHLTDGTAWFAAILPDPHESIVSFVESDFGASLGDSLPTWDRERWGFLSWQEVAKRACGTEWPRTEATMQWNEGQIFRRAPSVKSVIQQGGCALYEGRPVFVAECDTHNCRVISLDAPDIGYFWTTTKVRRSDLAASDDQAVANKPWLPHSKESYVWDPRNEVPILPEDVQIDGLSEGAVVVVKRPSWVTTRVTLAQGSPSSFLVFTHQLRRPT